MDEYAKIETLFDRNPENMKRVLVGQVRLPEFLVPRVWHITEKVDGKNVRIVWQPNAFGKLDNPVVFYGRTNKANFSETELDWLKLRFSPGLFADAFGYGDDDPGFTATVYGEFYGPKIQSGGWYRSDYGFRVFDVKIGDWWLNWNNVEDVAAKLGLETVPVINAEMHVATPYELETRAIFYTERLSEVAFAESGEERFHEGVVARTNPLLFMRDGRRLMWKLKVRDLT